MCSTILFQKSNYLSLSTKLCRSQSWLHYVNYEFNDHAQFLHHSKYDHIIQCITNTNTIHQYSKCALQFAAGEGSSRYENITPGLLVIKVI